MATTTPNFGWPVPTSTDLVKDGATAIEALGDSIDASLLNLKGGTTGQVLSKNSNTDMDFTWVTDAAGDITGVTAGVGISGGGTSGTVTVTNSMATAIDAKGDLVAGTADNTFARLAVGANNTVLTADSSTATGLKWAAPAGGGKVLQVVQGTLNTDTSTTSATYVDSGLTVTITPTSATSRIQVISMLQSAFPQDTGGGSNCLADFNLVRGSTQLQQTVIGTYNLSFGANYAPTHQVSFNYLDSPATTSATTYKVQMKRNTGTSVGFKGSSTAINSIVVMEIGA